MMMNVSDPRGPKAVALATDAGQWIKCQTKDGRKAYGVPSSEPGRYYLVGQRFCTCPARMHRPGEDCKHMLAVQLHCELVAEQQADDEDIFARFDDAPKPLTREAHPELARILGRPQRGVIPAHLIERED